MAAHEARADLLAGQLIEVFLLVGDREMAVAQAGRGYSSLARRFNARTKLSGNSFNR
jgi:hypothetical protein